MSSRTNDHTGQYDESQIKATLATYPDVEELYAALGRELGASATGEDPATRGENAFRRILPDIRPIVCGNEHLRRYCSDADYSDATSVAGMIAGTLVAAHFSGLNVVLCACIIARMGLRTLCAEAWRN
ncbi:MAG TPA: hypothetical protein VG326_10910 [Tepidisphaeraceae bacterium]|jgi:hypothetical protein|nr:hypothetical protein [Tepidisphaeraceae bacterium]